MAEHGNWSRGMGNGDRDNRLYRLSLITSFEVKTAWGFGHQKQSLCVSCGLARLAVRLPANTARIISRHALLATHLIFYLYSTTQFSFFHRDRVAGISNVFSFHCQAMKRISIAKVHLKRKDKKEWSQLLSLKVLLVEK